MRILLVNKFHWRKGGSETYHFAVADALAALGHEVAFFAMESEENFACDQSGYFVSESDYSGKTSLGKKLRDAASLVYSFEARRKFESLLQDFRPDVVHLNLVHRQLTLSILDAPSIHGVPVVYTAHDYIPVCPNCTMLDGQGGVCDDCLGGRFRHCVSKRCVKGSRAKSILASAEARFLAWHGSYRKIDRIIAPSDFLRGKMLEGGFPPSQVVTMRNFVDDGLISPAESPDETDKGRPYILFFGRLSKEKGIGTLVEAFACACESLPGWRLVIAGDGPERGAISAAVSALDLGDCVELVGFKQGDELRRLVTRATLTATPSECLENAPFAVLEALCAGTPAIGSRIGGIPELVREGETGFLAEPGDAASLAEAMVRGAQLAKDGAAYRAMQNRCRAFVSENCSQGDYMRRLVELYEQLAEAKRGN